MNKMTKEEFREILIKPRSECDGFELHLKHLWENNGAKSIFYITTGAKIGMMKVGRPDLWDRGSELMKQKMAKKGIPTPINV